MKHKLSTILLVEDEFDVRVELKRFLQRYSSNVITACNGEEGLEKFKMYKPNIVISDIKMPKMNGIDMAKEIKRDIPEQTIIFTTAHSDNHLFLKAIEMQVDGYILKSIDLILLKKKILYINENLVLQQEKRLYQDILDDIAQMQDSMLAVYDTNKLPIFYNKRLLDFLGVSTVEDFIDNQKSLSHKFEITKECYYQKNDSYISWIEEIKKLEVDKRVVLMRGKNMYESKFFLIHLSEKTDNGNIIVTFSEITTIVKKKHQYEHDANTDKLTQISNRAGFNMVSAQMIKKSKREKSDLSIVLIDIDYFKKINDSFGHMVGDYVLKSFTRLVLENIRIFDTFSRWGGEEFTLLLANTTLEDAKKIAENLRIIIEKYDFGLDKKLTCSFGVACRNDKDTNESLFGRVDKALYQAKNSGRNRVVVN